MIFLNILIMAAIFDENDNPIKLDAGCISLLIRISFIIAIVVIVGSIVFAIVSVVFVSLLYLLFSPGMVITSIFTSYINTTLLAWIWSVVLSIGIFFLVYWLYKANIKSGNPWIWTGCTYVVLSGLSMWLLFASESDNIVKMLDLISLSVASTFNWLSRVSGLKYLLDFLF